MARLPAKRYITGECPFDIGDQVCFVNNSAAALGFHAMAYTIIAIRTLTQNQYMPVVMYDIRCGDSIVSVYEHELMYPPIKFQNELVRENTIELKVKEEASIDDLNQTSF